MKYASIVFMQEHEAEEAIKILNDNGEKACFEYLLQWDYGEYHDTMDRPFKGGDDTWFTFGDYIISYRLGLPYIGLEKVIK